MSKRTKDITIPSLYIDRQFLTRLGKIIEKDVTEDSKNSFIQPREYTITAKSERLNPDSIKEILEIDIFPRNIKSMTFRVNTKASFILFELDSSNFSFPKAIISSDSDEKILKIEKDLNELFNAHKTNYNLLHKVIRFNIFILLFLLLVTLLSIGLLYLTLIGNFIKITGDNFGIFFYPFIIFLMYIIPKLYDYFFPYFQFNLYSPAKVGNVIRLIVIGAIGTMILNFIFEFSKAIIKLLR